VGLDTQGFIHCWFFSMANNCVTSKSIGMATKQKQAETAELIIESDSYEHFSKMKTFYRVTLTGTKTMLLTQTTHSRLTLYTLNLLHL